MKIAIITSCYIKLFPGIDHTPLSISAITYNLTEELVKMGHDVTLFATSDSITSAKLAKNLLNSHDPKIRNFNRKNPNHEKIYHTHLEKISEEGKKFDIIYSSNPDFIPYSKLTSTPAIVTMHGPSISKEKLFFHNEKIIATSKSQIKNNPDINFIDLINHGIKIEDFVFEDKPESYLAWLGRISPFKGPIEAISAAKKAKKDIILAGNIENKNDDYTKLFFKKIKEEKTAKYIGEVDKNKKIELLKNAQATLMPINIEEAFGLVAVESMACGTPVIAYKRGALPEVVKDEKTGFIVGNIQEMANAIQNINKIDRTFCRKYVEKNFTVEKMAKKYEKLFNKLISKQ